MIRFETSHGAFVVEMFPKEAPVTVENFLRYVDGKFYDGGRFHRTVRPDNQPDNTRPDALPSAPIVSANAATAAE